LHPMTADGRSMDRPATDRRPTAESKRPRRRTAAAPRPAHPPTVAGSCSLVGFAELPVGVRAADVAGEGPDVIGADRIGQRSSDDITVLVTGDGGDIRLEPQRDFSDAA